MVADLLDDDALLDLRPRGARTDPTAVVSDERRNRTAALPGLNPDLASWTKGPEPDRDGSGTAAEGGAACALCATRTARIVCRQCWRRACAADSWVMLSLCTGCATDQDVARGQRTGKVDETNWLAGPHTGASP